jgi:undecaprenyl-diphosphatase
MPSAVSAAILGIVQGLTEFLPVSSTAHVLIGQRLFGFADPASVFTEMIQLGSILAIVWLYRAKVLEIVSGLPARPEARRFALLVFVACLPSGLAAFFAADHVERVLHASVPVMAWAFIAGGVVMLIVERFGARAIVNAIDRISFGQAALIGLSQVLALVPGVSRSGATIIGGMAAGLDRPAAAEFSFFLAMPTMTAMFVRSVIELRSQIGAERTAGLAIGFVMAFVASAIVVGPFLNFVRRNGFAPFAWYRILVGLGLLAALAGGWL